MSHSSFVDRDQLQRMRHSAAHVLAQAVAERFVPDGPVQFGAGPPTEHGFHYDFLLPRPLRQEDVAWVDRRMREIARQVSTVDTAKIAILAALNIADELLQCRNQQEGERVLIEERVTKLTGELEKALQG